MRSKRRLPKQKFSKKIQHPPPGGRARQAAGIKPAVFGWLQYNTNMMVVAALAVVFILLVLNEAWWRTSRVHGELSRKFVHITVGSFVAIWPFFMSWNTIRFFSLAFLVGVALSKYMGIFKAIHSVRRPTWGEVFFALAVGLTTFVTHQRWVYTAALLQMSLADGLAAVIGVRYGKRNCYRILGSQKSAAGTLTFLIMALLIMVDFSYASGSSLTVLRLVSTAVAATILENLSGNFGLDNLLVPIMVAAVLTA